MIFLMAILGAVYACGYVLVAVMAVLAEGLAWLVDRLVGR